MFKKYIVLISSIVWFDMSYAAEQIPQINISANQNISQYSYQPDSSAPVTTISRQKIKASGAQNFSQLLAFTGLQLRDIGGDGSSLQVSMRGFGATATQNMLVLLNGRPLVYGDLGSFNFNQIPIKSIEKIQIYSSSLGILYGDQAVGGVINIVTSTQPVSQQYVGIGVGSYNTYQTNAGISRTLSQSLAYHLNILGEHTQLYRDHNMTRYGNIDLGVDKKFDTSQLSVDYQFYQQHLLTPGPLTTAQVEQDPRQSDYYNDYNNQTIHNLQSQYTRQLSDTWQLIMPAIFNDMSAQGIIMDTPNNQSRQVINTNPTVQGIITIGHFDLISISGLYAGHSQYTASYAGPYPSTVDAAQTSTAGFTQVNIPLAQQWHFIMGTRYAQAVNDLETNSDEDHAWVDNEGLLWQPNQVIDVYLRRAGNYRFPKTDEDSYTNTGKPLNTQTGISYETGFSWHTEHWKNLFSVYQLDLNNEIAYLPPAPGSSEPFGTNQNLPPTRRKGFSINLSYQPWQALTLQGIYHYVDAKFSSGPFNGNNLPFVAEKSYFLSSLYRLTSHWNIGLEDNFTGTMQPDNDEAQVAPELPSYSVINTSLQYEQKNWQVNLRINNIFNKSYFTYVTYSASQNDSYFYPAQGINAMINVTVQV